MKQPKTKRIILTAAVVLAVLILAGGIFLWAEKRKLSSAEETADRLFSEGRYPEAIDAYGTLLERYPLSFLGYGKQYPEIGTRGVLSCIDALLETGHGAQQVLEQDLIKKTADRAVNPALPDTFANELDRRDLLCRAIFAAERGDLEEAQKYLDQANIDSERSAELSDSMERERILRAALAAREEGRLEDALALLRESGMNQELIAEIEQQIVEENDRTLLSEAQEALDASEHDRIFELISGIVDDDTRAAAETEFSQAWTEKLNGFRERYAGAVYAGAWYSLVLGDEPKLTGDRRYDELKNAFSPDDTVIGGFFSFIRLRDGRVELLGDTLGAEKQAAEINDAVGADLGLNHAVILHQNGTVTNLGADQYARDAVGEWTGIKEVACGGFHSVGLTEQGTVVAAGLDADGQCQVGEWTDVVSVDAGLRHTVALHRDGSVSATGDNSFGQCDVSDWQNVIRICCGGNFTLGLTADFRLLAAGDNACGQCDVSDWQEVIGMSAGLWHTVALLGDGRVVTTGADGHDQHGVDGVAAFYTGAKTDLPAGKRSAESEYLYMGDEKEGPWLYCNGDGCIVAAFDTAYKAKPTRADLICTYGNPPIGILAGGGDRPKGAAKAAYLARQNHSVFALTGDYFTFAYNADGIQIRCGIVYKEEKDEIGFGFFPDGSMQLIDPDKTTAETLLKAGVRDTWVFGPALMDNGEVLDISGHPLSYNDVTMRTVMASICPYHHLGCAYGTSTLADVMETLEHYGCSVAYNLDGGRSSMMIFMDHIINRTIYAYNGWRSLQDMIGFLKSDLVPEYNLR